MDVREWIGKDNDLGYDIWKGKYQRNNETFDEWLDRVSGYNTEIRQLILERKFLFGGRILSNRGLQNEGKKLTYSNCYVIEPPEDNLESIFDTAKKLARTFSYGGGCGVDISKLAPRGAKINNAAEETTGAVSFMDLYNLSTDLIGQNGRRGALMISIDCDHPDIEEFINIKTDLNKLTKANISVKMNDYFMSSVDLLEDNYKLCYIRKETNEIIDKNINPTDLFRKLCENNWDYAEPGILFWDRIKSHNILSDDPRFSYAGVNPCAEEPLPAGGSCLLGAINLAEFVNDDKTFKEYEFKYTVTKAIEALNEVLDEGLPLHPLSEQRESVAKWRQIGLGIMGLADMLIKMEIEYGSEESLQVCSFIADIMIDEAINTSALLAKEHGPYPMYAQEYISNNDFLNTNTTFQTKLNIQNYGLRNSQLLTIAPTGSISNMLGVSGGIEPIFDTSYTRKTESLHGHDQYYEVYTPIVKEYLEKTGTLDKESSQLPHFFKTAKDIEPINRIRMQAVWQQRIDASISSTVNLPSDATIDDVMNLYLEAWHHGLKGMTIFREDCKRSGVLNSTKEKPKEEIPIIYLSQYPSNELNTITPITRQELGKRLNGGTYVKNTACGKLYITINRTADNELVEVFIDSAKSGGCAANAECIGRMASTMMRGGITIESIVDSVKGVKCSACTKGKGMGKEIDGLSCGDVLARTIQEEYDRFNKCKVDSCAKCEEPCELGTEEVGLSDEEIKAMKNPFNWIINSNECPECGEIMANEGGCKTCRNCGYSKCD